MSRVLVTLSLLIHSLVYHLIEPLQLLLMHCALGQGFDVGYVA